MRETVYFVAIILAFASGLVPWWILSHYDYAALGIIVGQTFAIAAAYTVNYVHWKHEAREQALQKQEIAVLCQKVDAAIAGIEAEAEFKSSRPTLH
ncbi:MAG: hypothetical protein HOO99_16655 [Hyphomicrobiaceae bacterium]|nr:hypothetical protein [Hyphomicrobiaceae bacterium]